MQTTRRASWRSEAQTTDDESAGVSTIAIQKFRIFQSQSSIQLDSYPSPRFSNICILSFSVSVSLLLTIRKGDEILMHGSAENLKPNILANIP